MNICYLFPRALFDIWLEFRYILIILITTIQRHMAKIFQHCCGNECINTEIKVISLYAIDIYWWIPTAIIQDLPNLPQISPNLYIYINFVSVVLFCRFSIDMELIRFFVNKLIITRMHVYLIVCRCCRFIRNSEKMHADRKDKMDHINHRSCSSYHKCVTVFYG